MVYVMGQRQPEVLSGMGAGFLHSWAHPRANGISR